MKQRKVSFVSWSWRKGDLLSKLRDMVRPFGLNVYDPNKDTR